MTVIAVGLAGIVLLLVLWLVQSLFEDVGDTASGLRERRKGRQGRE